MWLAENIGWCEEKKTFQNMNMLAKPRTKMCAYMCVYIYVYVYILIKYK